MLSCGQCRLDTPFGDDTESIVMHGHVSVSRGPNKLDFSHRNYHSCRNTHALRNVRGSTLPDRLPEE